MDDFDDGDGGLPDEMSTELPDLDTAVESEIEIDLEGVVIEPGGRSSGGARAQVKSAPRKASGGARKTSSKPAAKAAPKPAKKAAKTAKPARKAKPAKKKAARKQSKPAKKAAKKTKRKAGRKK